eukprot:6817109-Alexandrium_andersonii.AAC.1
MGGSRPGNAGAPLARFGAGRSPCHGVPDRRSRCGRSQLAPPCVAHGSDARSPSVTSLVGLARQNKANRSEARAC